MTIWVKYLHATCEFDVSTSSLVLHLCFRLFIWIIDEIISPPNQRLRLERASVFEVFFWGENVFLEKVEIFCWEIVKFSNCKRAICSTQLSAKHFVAWVITQMLESLFCRRFLIFCVDRQNNLPSSKDRGCFFACRRCCIILYFLMEFYETEEKPTTCKSVGGWRQE